MKRTNTKIDVYLEMGKKRLFAGIIEWPGWSRSGRDEESALQALLDYAHRYQNIVELAGMTWQPPNDSSSFHIVERLQGNSTTDFGAPGMIPSVDNQSMDEAELQRQQLLLKACWKAFDAGVEAAVGKELRKGPRGGGRELEDIIQHVMQAELGYLGALGWKFRPQHSEDLGAAQAQTREEALQGLVASAHGEIPERGPRGGSRWPARYFVRRDAWHVLDHLWEIQDREINR